MAKHENYRAYQIRIKQNHEMFSYFDSMCFNAKNLYNIGNFYIRQAYSGLQKEPSARHENETRVIDEVNGCIEELNEIKLKTVARKGKEAKLFQPLTAKRSHISYELLEGVFKLTDQVDYRSLPGQVNQNVMKNLRDNWKTYFESIKDFKKHPGKYNGMPKPPRYADKNGRKMAKLSNQICLIKDDHFVSFPKTDLRLNIGALSQRVKELVEIRVVPQSNFYKIEIVCKAEPNAKPKEESKRIIAIDLGVNNFATIVGNIGERPIVVKGGVLKSRNQWYNKQRAKYYSILRNGMNPKQGQFTSKRLQKLDADRQAFLKDYFHKVSRKIVEYCVEHSIGTIVVGKNSGWKQEVTMRKDSKQNFTSIPHAQFVDILQYKAQAQGIIFIANEESYTSLASLLDGDLIPTYGKTQGKSVFSGRRVTRGMYKSSDGTLINADANGAGNILRKVFPTAFDKIDLRDSGVVDTPMVLSIAG